jgi:hypothetical protein
MEEYCVYFHINPLKNEIFYVGKGRVRTKRAYSKDSRNPHWKNIVKNYGYIVDIIETGLYNEEAIKKEMFYINKIGRSDLGKGPLVNMTDGGEGLNGIKRNKRKSPSEETRKRMSLAKKGKTSPKKGKPGKKKTQEEKDRISKSMIERFKTHKNNK